MGNTSEQGGGGRVGKSDGATKGGARKNDGGIRIQEQTAGCTPLMYACQQGDVDQVARILQDNPATASERDRTGKTPLHYCAETRPARCAELVLAAAPELVDAADEDGLTTLHLAAISGNVSLMNFLLAHDASVKAVDNEGHSIVHWATVCGETGALRAALSAGAPPSTPDVHGGHPLHYAAQMCGAPTTGRPSTSAPDTPSMDSRRLGLEVLETLLNARGILVDARDSDGRPPLLWAASAGSAAATLALVAAGGAGAADAADRDGLTALHCAASRGHTDCLEALLLMCGVAPDVIDSNGCTALHYAVTLGHADATALLLAHGADAGRRDRRGRTPAHCGCAKGQVETVRMLGAHGADLWTRSARGDLPLHEAATSGRRQLVRWLLAQRPAQVDAANNDGRTPLHVAALNDNAALCKILLDHGAKINPVMRSSKNMLMTPLDCALRKGYRSTAKYLQLNGGVPYNRLRAIQRSSNAQQMNVQIKNDIIIRNSQAPDDSESESISDTEKNNRKFKRKYIKHRRKIKVTKDVQEKAEYEQNLNKIDSDSSTLQPSNLWRSHADRETTSKLVQTEERFIVFPAVVQSGDSRDNKNKINGNGDQTVKQKSVEMSKDDSKSLSESVASDNSQKHIKVTEALVHAENFIEEKAENIKQSDDEDEEKTMNVDKETAEDVATEEMLNEDELIENIYRTETDDIQDQKMEVIIINEEIMKKIYNEAMGISDVIAESIIDGSVASITQFIAEEAVAENGDHNLTKTNIFELDEKNILDGDKATEKLSEIELELIENKDFSDAKEDIESDSKMNKDETDQIDNVDKSAVQDNEEANETNEKNEVDEVDQKIENDGLCQNENDEETEGNIDDVKESEEILQKDEQENAEDMQENGKDADEKAEIQQENVEDTQENVDATDDNDELSKKEVEVVENQVDVEETPSETDEKGEKLKESEQEKDTTTEIDLDEGMDDKEQADLIKSEPEKEEEEKKECSIEKTENDEDNIPNENQEKAMECSGQVVTEQKDKVESEAIDENDINETAEDQNTTEIPNEEPNEKNEKIIKSSSKEYESEKFDSDGTETNSQSSKVTEIVENAGDVTKIKENDKLKSSTESDKSEKDYKSFKILSDEIDDIETLVNSKRNKDRSKKVEEDSVKKDIKHSRNKNVKGRKSKFDADSKKEKGVDEIVAKKVSKSSLSTEHVKARDKRDIVVNRKGAGSSLKSHRVKSKENISNSSAESSDNDTTSASKSKIKSSRSKSDSRLSKSDYDQLNKSSSEEDYSTSQFLSVKHSGKHQRKHKRVPSGKEKENVDTDSDEEKLSSSARKRRFKARTRSIGKESYGSDSQLMDSGFEPSPRSSRIPRRTCTSTKPQVNMTTVTQSIQGSIRRYHLERKIFQHLLELKRLQIRSSQTNEAVLVKRAIDAYHRSILATVGAGRYTDKELTFKSFEKFLYDTLRKLQKGNVKYLDKLPETPPLQCTHSTLNCEHATHAYTGIPCAAYITKLNHHTIPKVGFDSRTKGFLPRLQPEKARTVTPKGSVTLELCHGRDRQLVTLPADRLEHNKRYYVTFTVKGQSETENDIPDPMKHRHAKSC